MVLTDRLLNQSGVLTVNLADGSVLTLPVRCRVGSQYAAQSESPNYSARVGVTAYFTCTKERDSDRLRPVLAYNDTRILLTVSGVTYEVTNVFEPAACFKASAVRCDVHGNAWV